MFQRLLTTRVSMWTESQKISKAGALINHALSQCFRSYRLWLNKSISSSQPLLTILLTSQLTIKKF